MIEIWKPVTVIRKFNHYYEVVEVLKIKSGYFVSSKGRLKRNGRIRNNKPGSTGYINDSLVIDGDKNRRCRFLRHQIVMQTFDFDGYKDGYSVDHIDRDITNNCLENLRWASFETQVKNSERTIYKQKKVICLNDGRKFNSCGEAEKYYNLCKNSVSRVARGADKSTHGLRFAYIAD